MSSKYIQNIKKIYPKYSLMASDIGIKEQTVYKYYKGERRFVSEILENLLKKGYSLDYLATGEGPIMIKDRQTPTDTYLLDFYNVFTAAGDEMINFDEGNNKKIALPKHIFQEKGIVCNEKKMCVIRVDGNSMEPTIQDGTYILIECFINYIIDSSIYIIKINNEELAIKRLQKISDKELVLISDNKIYHQRIIKSKEIKIIAKFHMNIRFI